MTIKNGIAYPDGTDQSANFRHQTVTGENGEKLFFAPVRIRNDNDLKTFMVDKSARWTLPFGHSALKYKVLYFMTESEEMSEDFWMKINSEHSRENRLKRCLVPGKRRPLIPCPECHSCAKCPYPEYRDKHEMQEVVFDDEIKVQRTRSTESPDYHKLEVKWKIQGACKMMDEQNPLFAKAIILKEYNGYTVSEIAEILHCTEYDVRYYLRKATEIGKEFKKEYYRSDWEE